MARDTGNGTIYLLTNPSRESLTWGAFRLWKSTDNGQSFTLINTAVPSVVTNATSGFENQHFMADDYTWLTADGSYFYFAWCDRSDTFYSGGNSRPDPNIRLGKIRQ